MPAPERLTLALDEARVAVTTHLPGLGDWLRDALCPAFDEVVVPEGGATATVVTGAPAGERRGEDADLGLVPCFALDGEVVLLPGRGSDQHVVVDDETYGARYVISADHVDVQRTAPGAPLRLPTFRVVRELALTRMGWGQRIELHASGIIAESQVVLFAGPKRAGKTTLVSNVAASTGAAVVTNDRALLSRTDRGWNVRGVPSLIEVREGTIARLPRLFAGITSPGPATLTELARMLGVPRSPGGMLTTVALISIDESVSSFTSRPVDPDEAGPRLEAVRMGVNTEPRPPTVFEHGTVRPVDLSLLTSLAREVRCLDVRIGPSFYDDERAPAALLTALLDDG